MKSKPTYQELERKNEILRKEKAQIYSKKQEQILNSINDGIYINSPNYTIEYINSQMIKILGDDKTGQKCYKAIYNKEKICDWCIFDKLKKGDIITQELMHPSTNNYYITKNLLLDNGSKVTSYHDISKLKQNELNLQKQNIEYESLNEEYATINEEYVTINEELLIAKEKEEEVNLNLQERVKELEGIYSLDLLSDKYEILDEIYIEFVSNIVPKSMQFPDKVYVLLEIDNQIYSNIENYNLPKDRKYLSAKINILKKQIGKLIITYTEDLPFIDVFEQKLINAYAERISKITDRIKVEQELKQQNREYAALNEEYKTTNEELLNAKEKEEEVKLNLQERVKELKGIYSLGLLTEKNKTLDEIYIEFVNKIVPKSMQFPDNVYVLLEIDNQIYSNIENYNLPKDRKYLSAKINILKKQIGKLIITYTEDLPFIDVFEQKLINAYAERISKITERIKVEQELKQQNSEYAALNEEYKTINEELLIAKEKSEENEEVLKEAQRIGHLGNWSLDLQNNSLKWSDEIFRMFDLKPQEFEATYEAFLNNIHPDDRKKVNDAYTNSLETKLPYEIEHRLLLKTGKLKYVKEKCYTVFNKSGKPLFSYGIVIDITKEKLAEHELTKAKQKAEESDRLKSAFLANMSHEIRTPMNSILGFAGILKKTNKSAKQKEHFIDVIQKNGKHLLNLINDIIDISKNDASQLTVIEKELNLNAFLLQVCDGFNGQIDENVEIIIHKDVSTRNDIIITDETRLQQILTNLIGNAVKFTNSGLIEIAYSIKNNVIEFSVKDTGIGISENELQFVFDRFRQADETATRKYGGTGLGLAISKACAELLGGEIWVKSELGKGSTFFFTVEYKPTVKFEMIPKNQDELEAENLLEGKTILISEDDIYSFQILELYLESTNAKIIHVTNGIEAVEICKNNPEIDIVLMDINLPKLNGLSATTEILKYRPNLPIISQTANAMSEDRQKSLNAGCVDYISKPVDDELLLKLINKYL